MNGLFAADRALIVTEPGAWASDGVAQILRTISRIAARRGGSPGVAGVAVNRLGRTRDARYWHEQLLADHGDLVLGPVHLRAAVAEAAAQSLPVHGLGSRAGAPEAAGELDDLLDAVVPEVARPPAPAPSPPVASPGPPSTEPGLPLGPAPTPHPSDHPETVPGATDALRPPTVPTPPTAR